MRLQESLPPRAGLSRIELLVVICVVLVLTSMILPAVQSSREAARMLQCRNNLHQIGVALANYESLHKMWAPGAIMGFSWEVSILPHIDRADLYQLAFSDGGRTKVRTYRVPLYLCPSDPFPESVELDGTIYATNYLGNSGRGVLVNGLDGMFRHFRRGELGYEDGPIHARDVTEGLSNTASVSEVLHGERPMGGRSRLRTVWQLPQGFARSQIDEFRNMCRSIPENPHALGWGGAAWNHGFNWTAGDIGTSTYNHMLLPMEPSCINGQQWQPGIFSAGSAHPGGVHVLYADGHVQVVTAQIDFDVWTALGSRNGADAAQP